jgi:hypothetical protein
MSRAAMVMLPNGTYLYPKQLRWIRAFRKGTPPNLWVELHCQTIEDGVQIERIDCETWDQVDAVGNVLARSMAEYFPEVPISFLDQE